MAEGPAVSRPSGHPLHPPLVHLPMGLWTAAALWDLLAMVTGRPGFWELAFWCNGLALAGALIAAAAGFADFLRLPRDHPAEITAQRHLLVMSVAFGLMLASLLGHRPGLAPLAWWPVVASFAGVATAALGGWLGGELVYRYRLPVAPAPTALLPMAGPSPKMPS